MNVPVVILLISFRHHVSDISSRFCTALGLKKDTVKVQNMGNNYQTHINHVLCVLNNHVSDISSRFCTAIGLKKD